MSDKRKLTLAVLFILTIVLAAVSIFITIRIQQSNAPDDSQAAGFGATATKELYEIVKETFYNTPCNTFLSTDIVKNYTPKLTSELINYTTITATEEKIDADKTKICIYDLGDNRKLTFEFYPYDADSAIANTAEDLYSEINAALIAEDPITFLTGVNNVDSFYGTDSQFYERCRTTLFHTQNEFKFASLFYEGYFECGRSDLQLINDDIVAIISKNIDTKIVEISNVKRGIQ